MAEWEDGVKLKLFLLLAIVFISSCEKMTQEQSFNHCMTYSSDENMEIKIDRCKRMAGFITAKDTHKFIYEDET